MGERGFKEIHADLEPKKDAVTEAIEAAKELFDVALEASIRGQKITSSEAKPLDKALSLAYAAFFDSQEVVGEFNEALGLLKQNKKFMKTGSEAVEGFERLAGIYDQVNDKFESIILQFEESLVKLKLEARIEDDSDPELCDTDAPGGKKDSSSGNKKEKRGHSNKKCVPGCVIS